jgi:hypothetical protein
MKNPTENTPEMSGKASEIDDPNLLYGRIGYRIFLAYRDGARSPRGPLQGLQRGGTKAARRAPPAQVAPASQRGWPPMLNNPLVEDNAWLRRLLRGVAEMQDEDNRRVLRLEGRLARVSEREKWRDYARALERKVEILQRN